MRRANGFDISECLTNTLAVIYFWQLIQLLVINMARPTKCTTEITSEICTRLADGESLRSICADEHLPEKSSVLFWVVNNRKVEGEEFTFSDQYHAAREAAGYSHADEALDLRHDVKSGDLDHLSAKVILDALKWGAERMAPKRHSSRQEIDHTSSDGSMKPSVIELVAPDASKDDHSKG